LYDTYRLTGLAETDESTDRPLAALRRTLHDTKSELDTAEIFDAFWSARSALGPRHPSFSFPGPLARMMVHTLDRLAMAPQAVSRSLAISRAVASRPDYFPAGVGVEILHHPSSLEGMHAGPFEYFFTASRLDSPKRIDLLVRAMLRVPEDVRLLIAGT